MILTTDQESQDERYHSPHLLLSPPSSTPLLSPPTPTLLLLPSPPTHSLPPSPPPSILPEIQCVFGHLLESKLQHYAPESFWKTFKLWGQPVNVREQQDAFDFFCNLIDQVDEQLKVRRGRQKVAQCTWDSDLRLELFSSNFSSLSPLSLPPSLSLPHSPSLPLPLPPSQHVYHTCSEVQHAAGLPGGVWGSIP